MLRIQLRMCQDVVPDDFSWDSSEQSCLSPHKELDRAKKTS